MGIFEKEYTRICAYSVWRSLPLTVLFAHRHTANTAHWYLRSTKYICETLRAYLIVMRSSKHIILIRNFSMKLSILFLVFGHFCGFQYAFNHLLTYIHNSILTNFYHPHPNHDNILLLFMFRYLFQCQQQHLYTLFFLLFVCLVGRMRSHIQDYTIR